MGELEQVGSETCEQENARLDLSVCLLCSQHNSSAGVISARQPGFRKFSFPGSNNSKLIYVPQLTTYVSFLENWSNNSHTTFTIVSGVLPPAVGALFGWMQPVVMRWLSRFQGAVTRSRLDRAVIARYFAFLVISQLFLFTLMGVLISE